MIPPDGGGSITPGPAGLRVISGFCKIAGPGAGTGPAPTVAGPITAISDFTGGGISLTTTCSFPSLPTTVNMSFPSELISAPLIETLPSVPIVTPLESPYESVFLSRALLASGGIMAPESTSRTDPAAG